MINELKYGPGSKFKMSDLGDLHFFLISILKELARIAPSPCINGATNVKMDMT